MTNDVERDEVAVLAEVTRGDVVESVHRGVVVVIDVDGNLVASAGNVDQLTYFRSAAKPFQAIPVVESGAAEEFGFKKTVGVGTSAKWPVGVAAAKNDGVAAIVSQTPGALGYVELIFAIQTKTAYGAVQNANGKFVKASIESVTAAAAAAAKQMPADYRVSITNAPGDGVYPISSFTWLLLYQDPKDKAQSKAMVDFMKWALTDGQKFAGAMGYAPIPANVVEMEMKTLATIKVQ